MATALDVIADALRELGVLAAGEVATADEAISGLAALNRLVDGCAAERLMIYTTTRTTYALVAATQNYTVGTGGNFNVARPVYLDHVTIYDDSASVFQESPLTPLTEDAWAAVPAKSQTALEPTCYYYNPTYPTGTLSVWPVPTSTVLTGVVYAPQQVSEFAALTTTVSLPPGYRRFLVKNLAFELAPSYGRPASQELIAHAIDSKAVVKRANKRLSDMSIESAALCQAGPAYDIETG